MSQWFSMTLEQVENWHNKRRKQGTSEGKAACGTPSDKSGQGRGGVHRAASHQRVSIRYNREFRDSSGERV
jgi:hypothetical protein